MIFDLRRLSDFTHRDYADAFECMEQWRKDRILQMKHPPAQKLAWIANDTARFLQVWTAKEAYLKYLGIGLKKPPQEVEVVQNDALHIADVELYTELTDSYAMTIVYEKRHP